MTALTKAKMADQLFDELGLNKREAKEVVELFFGEIAKSLENNVQVKLSGFGNFDLREKGERVLDVKSADEEAYAKHCRHFGCILHALR